MGYKASYCKRCGIIIFVFGNDLNSKEYCNCCYDILNPGLQIDDEE
jgi:hypothetical protein